MAAAGEATQPLKCNTWVLKVPIHCVGCKREVKKLLQNIDGVYSTTIDSQLQKVTVSGNIDSDILVKKLLKTGKHAEVWSEKSAEKGKKVDQQNGSNGICQNKQQIMKADNKPSSGKPNDSESQTPTKNNKKETNSEKIGKETAPKAAIPKGSPGTGGKAKKGKGQNGKSGCAQTNGAAAKPDLQNANVGKGQGDNSVTLSPTFEQFSSTQEPPTVHVMSYNAAYPTKQGYGATFQVPSTPYMSYSTNEQMESYQVQATPFNSFDIFSDENPNGCSIM